jgi:hypothetical protein
MDLAMTAAGNESAWRLILREFRAEVDRHLANDPPGFRIDQNGGERLGGGIETKEHGRSILMANGFSKREKLRFRKMAEILTEKKDGHFRGRPF